MGGLVAKTVDQNMKKQQEFMLEVNRITVSLVVAAHDLRYYYCSNCALLFTDGEADSNAEPNERFTALL